MKIETITENSLIYKDLKAERDTLKVHLEHLRQAAIEVMRSQNEKTLGDLEHALAVTSSPPLSE